MLPIYAWRRLAMNRERIIFRRLVFFWLVWWDCINFDRIGKVYCFLDTNYLFSTVRNFALRERGFSDSSASDGVVGLREIWTKSQGTETCPVITSIWSLDHSRKMCLRIRSSQEWKDIPTILPQDVINSLVCPSNDSSTQYSSFASIRKAWKQRMTVFFECDTRRIISANCLLVWNGAFSLSCTIAFAIFHARDSSPYLRNIRARSRNE